jgi:hypothetical protein
MQRKCRCKWRACPTRNQNIEHTAYLRVMSQVDDRITNVVRQRVMPEIGSALDQALARITNDLKASIGDMVRTSIEETLRTQLGAAAAAPVLSKPEPASEITAASVIMQTPAAPPAAPTSSIAMEKQRFFQGRRG